MWLPDSSRDDAAEDQAAISEMTMIDETIQHFTAELKSIDPDLELVKASNHASLPGLVPGYWHILRKGMPTTILTLDGPNGEFREPGSWMYDWLLEQDMWNDRTQAMRAEQRQKAERAVERQKQRERQDRIQEFNERLASKNRTQILLPA